MTDHTTMPDLTRPQAETPADTALYDLVEERFRRLVRDHPAFGTFVGIHTEDERLGDGSRDAVEQEIARRAGPPRHGRGASMPRRSRRPGGIERELELHNVRRSLFDRRGPPRLGAPVDGDGRRWRPAVRDLRPRLRPAPRAARAR